MDANDQLLELLERGRAALQSGNRLAARGYLRRAARNAPDRLDIWQELCQVSDRVPDRIDCLSHIIELDPSNARAREELAQLRQQVESERAKATSDAAATELEVNAEGTADIAQEAQPDVQPALAGIRLDVTDEMRRAWDQAVAAGEPLHCIDHPHRETVLRCNRCAAPVCTDCVVRTPVGFRCKECVKAQQAGFYNARWYDWILAAIISFVLSIPASVITGLLGWWFSLIISPIAGSLIGGAVHWAVGRRRGRNTWWIVAVCIVAGTFIALVARATNLLSAGIYAFTATAASIGILRLGRSR
jgi:hypothetical protein